MNARKTRAVLCAAAILGTVGCGDEGAVPTDDTMTDGIDLDEPEEDETGSTGGDPEDDAPELGGPEACVETETFFREQVWAPFMSSQCFACHNPLGQAKHSDLVLQGNDVPGHAEANLATLRNIARLEVEGESLILVKAKGGETHGGGAQLGEDTDDYQALVELIDQLAEGPTVCADDADVLAYFEGVHEMDPVDTLRRAAFVLASRRPTAEEVELVRLGGDAVLAEVLKTMMTENGFSARVMEMFNGFLLTDKYIGGTRALDLLSETDFPSKTWYDAIADETVRGQQRGRSNTALAREPLELIRYIVENDRPFSDIITGNYTVANGHLARVYGLDTSSFADVDDQSDWQAVVIPGRPHAGVLTTPAYLNRFPTTATNRNRERAHMALSLFLNTDVMSLGARPIDTDSSSEHNPTMTNPQCTSCHEILDPVAGAFQNWNNTGLYRPTTWYAEMRAPGLGETLLPAEEHDASLQWLGRTFVEDPRFARAMVKLTYAGLTGRPALDEPTDPSAPDYAAQIRAFHVQDRVFRDLADDFRAGGYDFQQLIIALVDSPYFRADNVDPQVAAERGAELADLGALQLSSPDQLHRKIAAVTGFTWLDDAARTLLSRGRPLHLMYGGINSDSVIEPYDEVNGVMVNVVSRMANEMGCLATAQDFARPVEERVLFPMVATTDLPGLSDEAIEANVIYLHEQILGEELEPGDPRIADTVHLFENVHADGISGLTAGEYSATMLGPCQANIDPATGSPLAITIVEDPDYTVRAWMAVVSAMLGDINFIYE